jgi:hypothetical protein
VAAMWPTTSGHLRSFSVTGQRQKGKTTPRGTTGPCHGRVRELSMSASPAARPSHPRAHGHDAGRSVRCGATRGKR